MRTRIAMTGVLRTVEGALLATALLCALALGLILWEGGRWDRMVSIRNPVPRLVIGGLAFSGWHLVRATRRGGRRQWPVALGQLALLATGLAAGLLSAEHALRAWLRIQQGRGSMEDLAAHERGDAALRPNSRHPLVAIVRLSPNGLLAYELRPNLRMNFGVCRLRTNGAGMRDSQEYPVAREPGTVRILGLGDSGMFGWGVHQDRDYLSVLESNLNHRARGVRYEVLNAAVPGYNTFQEVEALRHRGLEFRPDTVVLGWCSNDTDLPFFLRRQQTFRKNGLFYLHRLLFDREAFRRETSPEARRAEDVDADRIDPRVLAGAGIDGVRRAFHELASLARRHGFHALVFGPMDDPIVGLCREAGLEYFNTLSIPADRHPGVRIHGIHPDSGGHAVLAGYLEQALESRGWLDPPGTLSP